MNGAFYIGATGLRAEQRALDVTANNIANMNTLGFKRSEARFSELVTRVPETETADDAMRAGLSGVSAGSASRVFGQGELKPTGKVLDIAINGEGFIELLGPAGQSVAWRGGSLKVGEDGFLAGPDGMPLKGMISVPMGAQSLTIGADGKVLAQMDGDATLTEIGQIDLLLVKNPEALTPLSEGVYALSEAAAGQLTAPGEEGAGLLVQGSVELSNVQLTDEMVALLITQRAYAANAQVIQAGDQLMAIANNLKR